MSIQRTYYCDGPDPEKPEGRCMSSASTASDPPYLPHGIIEVRERCDDGDHVDHFCGWDCLMKFAADQPIPEVISMDDFPGDQRGEGR
jgi:hypothetical protein